jgi:hypothetical protein
MRNLFVLALFALLATSLFARFGASTPTLRPRPRTSASLSNASDFQELKEVVPTRPALTAPKVDHHAFGESGTTTVHNRYEARGRTRR